MLEADYSNFDLPPGVDAESLRLAVYVDQRWVPLADSANDVDKKVVRATTTHFSTYGLVPDPKEAKGLGSVWEANGVVIHASSPMFGELFVSPTAIGFYLSGGVAGPLVLDISGLPTDGDNYLYIDDHDDQTLVTPADGGAVSVTLDGARQHYLWLQPNPGTLTIGEYAGHVDQCGQVGVREGDTCTLTSDVEGEFQIVAPNQVLDCDGHRISQSYANRGTGIGLLVPGFAQHYVSLNDITIRNCVIGGADAYFSYGIVAHDAVDLRIEGSVFEDSPIGLSIWSGSGAVVSSNQFVRTPLEAINFAGYGSGGPIDGRLEGNSIEMLPAPGGLDWGWGLDLYGMAGPMSGTMVADNTISGGTGGIRLGLVWSTEVTRNSLAGSAFAALEYQYPSATNRLWWNNFESSGYGVFSSGPAEISDGEGRGNWWGHDCPDGLFVAGVDSNDSAVVDSFPYERRDGWEIGLEPGCDVTAPEPPVILSPVYEEGASYITTLVILGTAEPFARVKVFEGTNELGSTTVTYDGNFAMTVVPLSSGLHTIYATATDSSGNQSSSSEQISFERKVVDTAHPIFGENGKFELTDVFLSNALFNPPFETQELQFTLTVDAVAGLGGNSTNHRFFVLMERRILDPNTLETLTSLYAATEIGRDTGESFTVQVGTEWDGTDETTGNAVSFYRAYPSDVTIAFVRLYVGPGKGLDQFNVPEFLPAELIADLLSAVNCPTCSVVNTALLRGLHGVDMLRFFHGKFLPSVRVPFWSEFDERTRRARTCAQAHEACVASTLQADNSDPNACVVCFDDCLSACSNPIKTCAWPKTNSHAEPCQYWAIPHTITGLTSTAPPPIGSDPDYGIFAKQADRVDCSVHATNEPDLHDVCQYSCGSEFCHRKTSDRERDDLSKCLDPMEQSQMVECDVSPDWENCYLQSIVEQTDRVWRCDYHCIMSGKTVTQKAHTEQDCYDKPNPLSESYP